MMMRVTTRTMVRVTHHTEEASVVEGDSSDCQRVRRGERLVAAAKIVIYDDDDDNDNGENNDDTEERCLKPATGPALRQLQCLAQYNVQIFAMSQFTMMSVSHI